LALSFVDFFQTYMREKQRDENDTLLQSAYADEHDLAERRAFKVLCNTYAAFAHAEQEAPGLFSDDEDYQKLLADYRDLLGSLGADQERIHRCEIDFARSLDSWTRFLGPWERGQAAEQEILQSTLAGFDADPGEPAFRVTYAATPLDRRIDPFETVGPAAGLFDEPDYRLHASERLRYYLPAYLAKLISARFRLPVGDAGGGIGGSVDIFSRRCGDDNAFYVDKLRSLTLCHEIVDAVADAYIRHSAGTDAASWWIARYNDSYGAVERSLVGDWQDTEGARLSLAEHGLYTLRGDRADGSVPRHGYWGIDGRELWLIEVYREGSTCFNPACRSNFAEGGLLPQELASLSQGGIPSGELRGAFLLHPCKIAETMRRSEKPDPADLGLMMFEDRPCEGEDPADVVPAIEIGGAVFTPAPMQVLRDLPGNN